MSTNRFPPKQKLQRLRASCDGCFNAKVKCSKSRPICSRCLACGTECKYSPSSRAGKPRADARRPSQQDIRSTRDTDHTQDDAIRSTFVYTSRAMSSGSESQDSPLFSIDTNWSTSSCSPDTGRHSASSIHTPLFTGDGLNADSFNMQASGTNIFNPNFSWTPDPSIEFNTNGSLESNMTFSRSKSMSSVPLQPSLAPWFDDQVHTQTFGLDGMIDHMNGMNTFVPIPVGAGSESLPNSLSAGCNCFAVCLEALQVLHSHSNPAQFITPFDIVLTINRKAVDGCAAMLDCRCIQTSGASSTTMLLATILSKIMSSYRAAAQKYFDFTVPQQGQNQPLRLMYGSYQVAGEDGRWLEMEILWRELRKLEEIFTRFKDVCSKGSMESTNRLEEGTVSTALTNHLGQELSFTFEVLRSQEAHFGGTKR